MIMKERIKTALEFLKEGQSFSVGELKLGAEEYAVLEVMGWSRNINFDNTTKSQCLRELKDIKVLFFKMLDMSPELNEFISNKSIKITLCFNDSGKGSIELCSEIENTITWKADIK
jgi:hypothetical protein